MAFLTAKYFENLKPVASGRYEKADDMVRGLRLTVHSSGAKSWVVRYRHGGRQHVLTLGTYPKLNLADARSSGKVALRSVAAGQNPALEKVTAREEAKAKATDQFGTVFEEYRKRHLGKKVKASTARDVGKVFERSILPRFKSKRLPDLTRNEIQRLLDDTVDRGAPVAANRIFAVLRHFLNYAVARGYLKSSPAMGIQRPTALTTRDRVLSDDEIRLLWRVCEAERFPFGSLIQMLFFTAARRDEVRGMMDSELNLSGRLWTIPGERTKNGLAHEIHLASPSMALLEALPRVKNKAGYIFSTNGETPCSGLSRAKRRIEREMLKLTKAEAKKHGLDANKVTIPNWRLHDIRRTVASGMARIGIALPVIEKCLNHISGSFAGIVGVYQRHEYQAEKKAAFEAWASHLESIITRKPAKILPMRRGA